MVIQFRLFYRVSGMRTWIANVNGLYVFIRFNSTMPLSKTLSFSIADFLSVANSLLSPAIRWICSSVRSQIISGERRSGSFWIRHCSMARILISSMSFFRATWVKVS
jgi:hypothetical protein